MAVAMAEHPACDGVALGLRDVSKQFGAVTALADVSISIRPGEVHAICGENGAGKSTLVKILTGVYRPDTGSVIVDDRPVTMEGPRQAQQRGIALVAQELSLCGDLSILDNIWLGSLRVPFFHRRRELRVKAEAVLALLGLAHLDLDRPLGDLRLGERQLVEIARALARDAQVLILDEPTATLSDAEIDHLFKALAALKAEGRSIVYISHRLGEVFTMCDVVTVLRGGRWVATRPTAAVSRDDLIELMLGRSSGEMFPEPVQATDVSKAVTIAHLAVPARVSRFDAVARGGRILCIAGQVGSGATDVVDALAGLVYDAEGDIAIDDTPVALGSTARALRSGLMLVSGDRVKEGVFLDLSVRENLCATSLMRFTRLTGLDVRGMADFASGVARTLRIDARRMGARARDLSGGNQQKLAFGRYLGETGFGVLLMNEPTRGVDVGARAEIYRVMRDFCARGWALVLTSTDLEEVLGLGDDVITMYRGAVVGRYDRGEATMAKVVADITHPPELAA